MDAVGGRVSVGWIGVCWDNAVVEPFWAALKVDHFYRYVYASRAEVYESVGEWIDALCNCRRIHTTLGGLGPIECELVFATRAREAA